MSLFLILMDLLFDLGGLTPSVVLVQMMIENDLSWIVGNILI